MTHTKITVSILYAPAPGERQQVYHQTLSVACDSSIYEVLLMSGIFELPLFAQFAQWCHQHRHESPTHHHWLVGIYSVKKSLDTPVVENDRIEIYRPLYHDPMSRRKAKSKIALKKLAKQ